MKRLLKLILGEFKISFWSLIIISIAIAFLSLLPLIFQTNFDPIKDTQDHPDATPFGHKVIYMLKKFSPTIVQVFMYTVIVRIRSVLRDKSTLDKNRVSFLTHTRHEVVFSKVLVDLVSFILPIFLSLFAGSFIVAAKGGEFDSGSVIAISLLAVSIIFIYLITSLGMRLLDSLEIDKILKYIYIGIWISCTVGITVIGSTIFGIISAEHPDVITWTKDNQIWISLIPFINFLTPFLEFYQMTDHWTVAPLIIQIAIATIFIWNPLTKKLKTYLTT